VWKMLVTVRMSVFMLMGLGGVLTAPLSETRSCSMEYVTIWDHVVQEQVNKVVCETEFKEICDTAIEEVCRTEPVCVTEERMVCEDSVTTKCGLEKQLVNQTFVVKECKQVKKQICEYEWLGEGENKVWTPVEGSCVEKPFEECEDVTKFDEQIVEKEVCREIPIEDCQLETNEVCDIDATREVCEDQPIETCEILPHEECREITEKVPKTVSRKVAQLFCDGEQVEENEINDAKEETKDSEEDEEEFSNEVEDISEEGNLTGVTINEIFGEDFGETENVSKDNENVNEEKEVKVVDEDSEIQDNDFNMILRLDENVETTTFKDDSEEDTTLQTEFKTTESAWTTTDAVEVSSSSDEDSVATTTESFDQPTETKVNESSDPSGSDGSRIVFSDDELNKRNEILATRRNIFQHNTRTTTTLPASKKEDNSSKIFFPDS